MERNVEPVNLLRLCHSLRKHKRQSTTSGIPPPSPWADRWKWTHIEGLGYFYYGCVANGNGKDTPEEVTAECITATRVRFLPERNVQQNGAVTRNLVGNEVFWVDVESMGANPDKVESPDDETEEGNDGSFG